jgi:hypothetical protein
MAPLFDHGPLMFRPGTSSLSIHILQNTVRTQTGKGRDNERPRTPRPRAKALTHLLLMSKPRCYPTDADALMQML